MKNLSKVVVLSSLSVFALTSSCYYDNYEDMYQYLPEDNCETPLSSFSADIQPWIDAQCVSCHGAVSPQAGLDLTTHANVSSNAANILDRISREAGDGLLMPQGSTPLDDCTIEGFSVWIDLGTPNN